MLETRAGADYPRYRGRSTAEISTAGTRTAEPIEQERLAGAGRKSGCATKSVRRDGGGAT